MSREVALPIFQHSHGRKSHLFHCPKRQQGYWRFRNGKPFSVLGRTNRWLFQAGQFDTLIIRSILKALHQLPGLACYLCCPHHLTFLGLLPLLHQMLDHLNSRDWRGSVSVCWASHQSTSYKNSQFAWHLVAVIGLVTYIASLSTERISKFY